jgi:predicted transcriptional regulator
VSAAPQLFPSDPDSDAGTIIAAGGTHLTVREAASLLGIAESTLRRTIKQSAEARGSDTFATCEYRGQVFTATRKAARQPWKVVFREATDEQGDVSRAAIARVDGRIAQLRVAMLPVAQEPALEHIPGRPWWKFWAKR